MRVSIKHLLACLAASLCAKTMAQTVEVTTQKGTEKQTVSIDLPRGMTYPIDSLLHDWKAKNELDVNRNCIERGTTPYYPDSVYITRLQRIPKIMEMPYNDVVRKFIDMYTGRLRQQVSFMLGATNFYMPLFEEALDAYGLPLELKYLPVIESALNPTAISRAGAAGLWQFMLKTGRLYGLEKNSLVDERFDPVKSTWAAARYLREMYDIFKDWSLVIAAYNCGPGNINKAIRRAGGERDYWKIYPYLPKETRGYVPAFIAANYIMNYYCEHDICPMQTHLPSAVDTVQVHHDLHLRQVSEMCSVPMDRLQALNPQYRREIIPGNSKPYVLCLPITAVSSFIDRQDSIYAYKAETFFANRTTIDVPESAYTTSRSKSKNVRGNITYRVRKGDTLGRIAARHGVSLSDLRRWNGIKGNHLRVGQVLRIHK